MSRFVIVVDATADFMMPGTALYVADAKALVTSKNDMLKSPSRAEPNRIAQMFTRSRANMLARVADCEDVASGALRQGASREDQIWETGDQPPPVTNRKWDG